MLTAFLIIAFSVVMLLYWFRYSCILILRNQSELAQAAQTSGAFNTSDVQERLRHDAELDPVLRDLERDYRMLTYLIAHAPGMKDMASFEHKMLLWDCRMMKLVYRLTRSSAPAQARRALSEMAEVLDILGQQLRERAGTFQES